LRGARYRLHGEHVAYGILVQLAVEGQYDKLSDLADFLVQVGLPVSLADLDVPGVTPADMAAIAMVTITSPHVRSFAHPIGPREIENAMAWVEAQHAAQQGTHI